MKWDAEDLEPKFIDESEFAKKWRTGTERSASRTEHGRACPKRANTKSVCTPMEKSMIAKTTFMNKEQAKIVAVRDDELEAF